MRYHFVKIFLPLYTIIYRNRIWSYFLFLILPFKFLKTKKIKRVYTFSSKKAKSPILTFQDILSKLDEITNSNMSLWSDSINMMNVQISTLTLIVLICFFHNSQVITIISWKVMQIWDPIRAFLIRG